MKKGFWILTFLFTVFFSTHCYGISSDRPYDDLHKSHWAYEYIETLRKENITDGWISSSNTRIYFYPDNPINRGEYTLMMVKALGLQPDPAPSQPFIDVTPKLKFYNRIDALPWLSTARQAGLIHGDRLGRFFPEDPIRRDEAVAILIRSLGLSWYAQTLTNKDIRNIMIAFPDNREVNSSLVAENALAIKLGIIIGYPDGKLHPERRMSRAEAATVIYRSMLFELTATPNPFTPDGDGIDDTTTISFRILKHRPLQNWQAFIGRTPDRPIKTFNAGKASPPPVSIQWSGADDNGQPVPPGTYYYWGWVMDAEGKVFPSVKKPLLVEHRRLWAGINPNRVAPGANVALWANTTGYATSVTVTSPLGQINLNPRQPTGSETNSWHGSFTVPLSTPDGAYSFNFMARYSNNTRNATVDLLVEDPILLSPDIKPNPAYPGKTIALSAQTSLNIARVEAVWPGNPSHPIKLMQTAPGSWAADYLIPQETKPGVYRITFQGYTRNNEKREAPIDLAIGEHPLKNVIFILTD